MSKSIEKRIGRPNGIKSLASGGFIFSGSNIPVRNFEKLSLIPEKVVPIEVALFSSSLNSEK